MTRGQDDMSNQLATESKLLNLYTKDLGVSYV